MVPVRSLMLAMWIVLAGCGKQAADTGSKLGAGSPPVPASGKDLTADSCPIEFPSHGLCAALRWVKGPAAGGDSTYELRFWKRTASASGPYLTPEAEVGSYVRMTCCGSISFPHVAPASPGVFSVTKVALSPGTYEVYVQLKKGDAVEKRFVRVTVGE